MALSNSIVEQLKRIGALLPEGTGGSAIDVLINQVIWPDVAFSGSTERMRWVLAEQGLDDVSDWSEQALQDEMPSLFEFRFLPSDSRGRFWDDWEDEFASVDSAELIPFASDSYYFYFLANNADDETDPLVYSIDHEETDTEPYDEDGLVVSRLLSIIETETKAD